MAEPAAKKAKTGEAEPADKKEGEEEKPVVDEAPKELEDDALADSSPKIKEPVAFRTEDTTLNVVPSTFGNVLMTLSDGGLQYLLAGARANVGLSSGRYMFEAKVVEVMNPAEDPAARQKTPMPRSQLCLGFSTSGSELFLGEGTDGVCFDTEGNLIFNKKKSKVSQKFGSGDTLAVVLNLDDSSPNKNTISLFKNGERASPPQALPEQLVGKALHPTLTFKNLSVHYNFGPAPLSPLPFTCRMISDASTKDSVVLKKTPAPKDGKYDVVFPVCLPDEGTFDWLDTFLQKNPNYTELSDRSILRWAELSGLNRGKANNAKNSNDKPDMGFGIQMMDDGSVRRVIQHAAPIQPRSYVVMEVKSNLLKDERKEAVAKWPASSFKRTSMVMMGDASTVPKAFKEYSQTLILAAKQEASDAEFKTKKAEEKRKKLVEKRQKELEKERKKALKQQKKMQEAMKKKLEDEKKKKELADKGEEAKDGEEEEEKKEEDKEEEEEEDEKEDEEMPEAEEAPPKVELTAEEKRQAFCKKQVPDLTAYNLNTAFVKFSVPEKDEGFDDIKFEWAKAEKCKEYVKSWIQDRKLTTRVEDLTPSEWSVNKFKEWQKALQGWHQKQNQYRAALSKKAADKAAKEAAKAAKKAAKEKAQQEAEAKKKAEEAAKAAKAAAGGEEEKEEGKEAEAAKEPEPMDVEEEKEEEEEQETGKIDFDKLDVFGVEDILDVGAGEPLFMQFAFEDWTMMSLRFEIHLLTHSFKRDVNDPDRIGIHADHLAFYYNKYFKKQLSTKFYGVETVKELLELIRDTVVVNRKNQVVEPQLPDDMESLGIFIMLTEEARRDRNRRIDLGDDSAKLKLTQPQGAAALQGGAAGAVRPVAGVVAARPFGATQPGVAPIRPAANPWAARPGFVQPAQFRPMGGAPAYGQARPFQQQWGRPQWRPS